MVLYIIYAYEDWNLFALVLQIDGISATVGNNRYTYVLHGYLSQKFEMMMSRPLFNSIQNHSLYQKHKFKYTANITV